MNDLINALQICVEKYYFLLEKQTFNELLKVIGIQM